MYYYSLAVAPCSVLIPGYENNAVPKHWVKLRRGLICGIMTFPIDDHYRLLNATWAHDLCSFSGYLMGKNDKVRDNMTQMINDALAVASVFISYWILIHFYSQRGGALYMRQTAYARTVEFLMYVSYCGLVF